MEKEIQVINEEELIRLEDAYARMEKQLDDLPADSLQIVRDTLLANQHFLMRRYISLGGSLTKLINLI